MFVRCSAVYDAAVHPDTGEEIPWYFRMSSFVPVNVPIAAGMVLFGSNPAAQLFWQWANQSYNAGMNYANRNATLPVDLSEVAMSYVAATGIACGVALGAGKWSRQLLARGTLRPVQAKMVERVRLFAPLVSSSYRLVSASSLLFTQFSLYSQG